MPPPSTLLKDITGTSEIIKNLTYGDDYISTPWNTSHKFSWKAGCVWIYYHHLGFLSLDAIDIKDQR